MGKPGERAGSAGRRALWIAVACVAALLVVFSIRTAWSQSGQYVIIGWNDLGMHCANKEFNSVVVLPPYNTMEAQVIRRGEEPSLVKSGVTVKYDIPGNTHSVGKTDFWDYVKVLFGVQLPPNVGLTGNGLTGRLLIPAGGDRFEATGIPVTPYTDMNLSTEDPYQLARLQVLDSAGNVLAKTQPVIPVSNEINCVSSGCHISPQAIVSSHPAVNGYDPSGPVLCAGCHQSNALGTKGIPEAKSLSERMHSKHADKTNDCYSCHPGPKTRCLRDVMSTQKGMKCQDCHGNVANVAATIASGRRPWLDEPDCGKCHGAAFAVESGKLYRQSHGHHGVYCSACHGSPHVIFPSREARDNQQNIALQGSAGTLQCVVCHGATPGEAGPHGLRGGSRGGAASSGKTSGSGGENGAGIGGSSASKGGSTEGASATASGRRNSRARTGAGGR